MDISRKKKHIKKHEQAIIDLFLDVFKEEVKMKVPNAHSFSLSGQDNILGGDYLLTANTCFTIVEFKHRKEDIILEGRKKLRKELCLTLKKSEYYKLQSLQCHFIGWSDEGTLDFNKYYPQVCNKHVFPSAALDDHPCNDSLVNVKELVDSFLQSNIGADYATFTEYTALLFKIADKKDKNIEIVLKDPDSDNFGFLEMNLESLNTWLVENSPQQSMEP